ncbi:hypothetical protein B0T25DRAFT_554102 [Lasiosphaeria hispida]|uniref:Azaphilone pigments biosynthesis cluster protein L N-terminal domain-containing protein n=1 Tax=Lasiosphaeria hispida TaxID=260671 RepID=A0AAJ0HD06_9PEZI|nr:hypothetical protein B0T25DRAFT_554102 [Lasiosphaeria hispida]
MADPISLSSGVVALMTFTLQSSVVLYKAIDSYRSHPKNVRDLKDELEALAGVLQALSETAEKHKEIDLTALKLPLLRCGKACHEFEEALAKCSSRSGGLKTSFRDWAKLKYMGDGIDEFRRMLAGYKATIVIALAHANLQQSSLTIESLDKYKSMIQDTTTDLEDHLQNVDDKLKSTFLQAADRSNEDAVLVRQMQEERSSTQQCLVICAQLSAYISQIQPTLAANGARRSADARAAGVAAVAEQITADGLEGCKDALGIASKRLEEHLISIVDRLMATSKKTLSSPEETANLDILHSEWQTARLCIDLCSKANESVMKINLNVFENLKGEAEVLQFFASTTGRVVHAKDIFLGAKGVQFGGQLSDATVQQICRDFSPSARMAAMGSETEMITPAADGTGTSQFLDRYGRGFKLIPKPAQDDKGISPGQQGEQAKKTG